jgi:hypothetical protein
MRGQHGVRIRALPRVRIGVPERRRQPGQGMEQVVLGVGRDLVRLDRAGTSADDDLAFSPQQVADPPQPDLAHIQDAGGSAEGLLGLVDQDRVEGGPQTPGGMGRRPSDAGRSPGPPRAGRPGSPR